jgi:photosynthetic reaction center cytochrome c subunit
MSSCRRVAHILAGLVLGVVSCAVGARAQAPQPAHKTAAEAFKNIQILKDMPADQLFPAMQFISASLGVECKFCHVEHEFDKDDKDEKKTARKMMTMMFAINKDSFDGKMELTCNSCHNGSAQPAAIPPIEEQAPKPTQAAMGPGMKAPAENAAAAMANVPPMPNTQQILEKYVAAIGGAEALAKISSRIEKGTLSGFGPQSAPVEIFAKAPNKRVSIVKMQHGDGFTAYDGEAGWMTGFGDHIQDLEGADLYAIQMDADFSFAASAPKFFHQVRVGRPEKVGEHDAWVLLGINRGQPPVKLYFDKESGLLLRKVAYAQTPLGRYPTQVDYADYRALDGVQIPYRWTVARPMGSFTIQVEEAKQNVPVDDAKFAKPAPKEEKPPSQ